MAAAPCPCHNNDRLGCSEAELAPGAPTAMSQHGTTFDSLGLLPDGWKTRVDPASGRQMFYNRSTGETSWERPSGVVATSNPVARPAEANIGVRVAVAPHTSMEIEEKVEGEDVFFDPPHSGPVPKCLCALFCMLGMVVAGIFIMLLFVVVEFEERGAAQVFFLIASFFGVIASCSLVMCLMLLLPRYTGTLGIKYLRYKHHEDLLQQENWVWSMHLKGNPAKKAANFAKGMFKIWAKSAQLFALTYDKVTIEELPTVVVRVGDLVLLDLDKLAHDPVSNQTASARLAAGAEQFNLNNGTAEAAAAYLSTALEYSSGPESYRYKFYFFAAVCVFVFVLVVCSQCMGVLEGKCGDGAEHATVGVLGFFIEFAYIPLFLHLLEALDCTRMCPPCTTRGASFDCIPGPPPQGVSAQQCADKLAVYDTGDTGARIQAGIQPVYRWDADPSVECFASSGFADLFDWYLGDEAATTGCVDTNKELDELGISTGIQFTDLVGDDCHFYVNHQDQCGVFDRPSFNASAMCCACGGGEHGQAATPPHVFFFVIGMACICIMQWPTAFFLMVRPDTHADPHKLQIWDLIRPTEGWRALLKAQSIPVKRNRRKELYSVALTGMRYVHRREEAELHRRLTCSASKLRDIAHSVYGVSRDDITEADQDGCCSEEPDTQADGCSKIIVRPREVPISFMLECTVVSISVLLSADGFTRANGEFSDAAYDRGLLQLKLASIATCHMLLCLFYCNPLTLLGGVHKCSPYVDVKGIDHRTKLWQLGYPYNWEPLNFFRSALMAVCCSFAVCELLSFNARLQYIDCGLEVDAGPVALSAAGCQLSGFAAESADAMGGWVWSVFVIAFLFSVAFVFRWRVFWRDRALQKPSSSSSSDEDDDGGSDNHHNGNAGNGDMYPAHANADSSGGSRGGGYRGPPPPPQQPPPQQPQRHQSPVGRQSMRLQPPSLVPPPVAPRRVSAATAVVASTSPRRSVAPPPLQRGPLTDYL